MILSPGIFLLLFRAVFSLPLHCEENPLQRRILATFRFDILKIKPTFASKYYSISQLPFFSEWDR